MTKLRATALISAMLILAACDNDVTSSIQPQSGVLGHMQDPCPECDGIFLTGDAATADKCMLARTTDSDHDGVDDTCEFKIAAAFAPELVFDQNDVRRSRQTYWGVHRAAPGLTNMLNVAYLLAYNDDAQHTGDSEYIELRIVFDSTLTTGGIDGRWVVTNAWYSAHYGYNAYGQNDLQWVDGKRLDRPLVWVSNGKHANYNNDANCDNGGLFDWDECELVGSRAAVDVFPDRDIGSFYYRKKDVVYSLSGLGGIEYLWNNVGEFNGWHMQQVCVGPCSAYHVAPYGERLRAFFWDEEPIMD